MCGSKMMCFPRYVGRVKLEFSIGDGARALLAKLIGCLPHRFGARVAGATPCREGQECDAGTLAGKQSVVLSGGVCDFYVLLGVRLRNHSAVGVRKDLLAAYHQESGGDGRDLWRCSDAMNAGANDIGCRVSSAGDTGIGMTEVNQ